jgi:hypothetical protein
MMTDHRSFRISDASLRDIPGFLVTYIILTVFCVLLGLVLQSLPGFWRGLVLGTGLGLSIALALLYPTKKVDVGSLPEPSEGVKAKCNEPGVTLPVAVKAYRDETGVSLTEAAAVMKDHLSKAEQVRQSGKRE